MKDKVVLITGSSQGIGKAIAAKFASLGANVALNDIPQQEENLKQAKQDLAQYGTKVEYFLADVSNLESCQKMAEDIKAAFGKIDVLVNNAGITKDRTLMKMTPEEWEKVIAVNLTGAFNVTKSILPSLIETQGAIVSLSSVVGQAGNFGQTNYSASKAGVIGLTKSLSKEVGRFGVRVNAVAPGFIETPMTAVLPEEMKGVIKKFTAMGRFGQPEEIANAIAFLASDQASFITGAVLNIDGGLSI